MMLVCSAEYVLGEYVVERDFETLHPGHDRVVYVPERFKKRIVGIGEPYYPVPNSDLKLYYDYRAVNPWTYATTAQKWYSIRLQRNALLDATDCTDLTNYPHASAAVRTEWEDYRDELRDLPDVYAGQGPDAVVFPTPPEVT